MAKAEYETALNISYQQTDFTGHWKLSDLFSKLSDIATTHAEMINVWRPEMLGSMGWIVSKVRIRILHPIKFEENIKIKTWAGEGTRVIFPRYFAITNGQNKRCIEAVSLWTLLDLKQRRILMPSRVGITFPTDLNLEKPVEIETDFSDDSGYQSVLERKVVYSDIDTNQHMNNARYIEWILDLLAVEKFEEGYICDFSIYFKKETAPNQIMRLELKEEEEAFYVRGYVDEQLHFVAEGLWKKY